MRFKFILFLPVLCLLASGCFTAKQPAIDFQARDIQIDSTYPKQEVMEALLLPYRLKMDTLMNEVIGYSLVPLSKAQPECTMGNFMADAQLAIAQKYNPSVALSIINYGGMRIPYLSPGALTKGNFFEMMPFDDDIVLVKIPGKVLRLFCNHIAAYGGWPVSGMSFIIKDKKATKILVGQKPLNDQLVYLSVMPDYVANGGDHCGFLIKCHKEKQNIFVRDALMEYVKELQAQGKKINPQLENRITYAR